jgi:hypothetical protein
VKYKSRHRKSKLKQALSSSGILMSRSEDDIVGARKQYWKAYRKEWRKNYKKDKKSLTIDFTSKEHQRIKAGAIIHNRSITRFIKESSLAYCNQDHLIPDPIALNLIREQLEMNYNLILALTDENQISKTSEQLLIEKLTEIEALISEELRFPNSLQKLIDEKLAN